MSSRGDCTWRERWRPVPTYGFVDGGYLRKLAEEHGANPVDPSRLVASIVQRFGYRGQKETRLIRTIYYDARPDEDNDAKPELRNYWEAIERRPDTPPGLWVIAREVTQETAAAEGG